MRLCLTLLLLAATATATPLTRGDDRDAAATSAHDLLAWKATVAGRTAIERGYAAPPSVATPLQRRAEANDADVTNDDEIARFVSAQRTIAHLEQLQPDAMFSMDTPFALLSPDEFIDRVAGGRPDVRRQHTRRARATEASRSSRPRDTEMAIEPTAEARDVLSADTVQAKAKAMPADVVGSRFLFAPRQLTQSAVAVDGMDVDWARDGCVTRVRDRGTCKVGYVFSVVSAIETNLCITSPTKKLVELSMEDAASCRVYATCTSGTEPEVYHSIAHLQGRSLCTEASYPYTLLNNTDRDLTCRRYDDPSRTCSKVDVQLATYVEQQFPNHVTLENIVRQRAVTASIAMCPAVQFYKGGVIRGDAINCSSGSHIGPLATNFPYDRMSVLIVGFGTRNGIPVWKIKNSLGTSWGDAGYGYIERGFQGEAYGAAGIELFVTYPLFTSDVPASFDALSKSVTWWSASLVGEDLKTVPYVVSNPLASCFDVCRREPGCVGFVQMGDHIRRCHLKASVDGMLFLRGLPYDYFSETSGVLLDRARLRAEICLPLEDNVDFATTDNNDDDTSWFDFFHALTATPGECCDMCLSIDDCNIYTWTQFNGGTCYLKDGWLGDYVRVAKAPAADGTPLVRSGVLYTCKRLLVDTDFPGFDLKNVPATKATDCCAECTNEYECAGFSWSNYNGGTCWLKTWDVVRNNTPVTVRTTGVISALK